MPNTIDSFSEFMEQVVHIERFNDTATIIVKSDNGETSKLPGFRTTSASTDYEIYEEGFVHLRQITDFLNNF